MLATKFQFIWESGFRGGDFFFRNQPTRNKNGLCRPCLLADRAKMSILYRGPSIDASYQFSIHLVQRFHFERRRFLRIGKSETKIACGAMFVNGSERNAQSSQRTFHRCYLPNVSSFWKAVSEEENLQKSTNQKHPWPMAAMFIN